MGRRSQPSTYHEVARGPSESAYRIYCISSCDAWCARSQGVFVFVFFPSEEQPNSHVHPTVTYILFYASRADDIDRSCTGRIEYPAASMLRYRREVNCTKASLPHENPSCSSAHVAGARQTGYPASVSPHDSESGLMSRLKRIFGELGLGKAPSIGVDIEVRAPVQELSHQRADTVPPART